MSSTSDFLKDLPEYVQKNVRYEQGFYFIYDESGLLHDVVKTETQVYESVIDVLDSLDGVGRRQSIRELVDSASERLYTKLLRSELKYSHNSGWKTMEWQPQLCHMALHHLFKGDPVDVMAYAAFATYRGWGISPLPAGARDVKISVDYRVKLEPAIDHIELTINIPKDE